jgi:hypothetical protein
MMLNRAQAAILGGPARSAPLPSCAAKIRGLHSEVEETAHCFRARRLVGKLRCPCLDGRDRLDRNSECELRIVSRRGPSGFSPRSLEGQIPDAKRREWFREDRGKGVGANDDPRWKAGKTEYWAASDADDAAAWALAHACPVTLAGAAALLRYAHDQETEGHDWPCDPPDEASDEDWHATFHLSLAAALEGMSP